MKPQAATETIWTNVGQVGPRTGYPMPARQEYVMPRRVAEIRYQRGHAKPAARFYLEGLKRMGLAHIMIADNAEPSIAREAKDLGIRCFTSEGEINAKPKPKRGRPKKNT